MTPIRGFVAVALLGVVVGGASVASIDWARGGPGSGSTTTNTGNPFAGATQGVSDSSTTSLVQPAADDFSGLYNAIRPSIVEIDTTGQAGRRRSQQVQGQGSGVVLDTNGDILTNNHVINGSQTIEIIFADGTTARANVIGTDAADDLAIVKTDANASELHPATVGDSGAVKIGNVVAAIGNPFGLDGSFSTGVVSGLDRTLSAGGGQSNQQGLMQTDAAVNEGSSGGGLFNMRGELIAINSALENPDASTFAGVAYAVPINSAKPLIRRVAGG